MISNSIGNYLLLVVAIFAGAIVFSLLRVWIYDFLEIQPQMHPGMFFIFAPVLAFSLCFIVVVLHAALSRFFDYRAQRQWVVAGFLYSTIFLY